jgi:pSer/pThr/pTyr-binding forkhead associated (FHA) protein
MQVCANCGHTNRPGVLFCENCGTSLTGKAAVGTTKAFDEAGTPGGDQVTSAGTDYFMPNAMLRVEIEGGPEPIIIKPKQELIFGRRDPATGAMPDIDLTPYAGYRMGVSRRHAAIRAADDNHLDVWDLGSSNGTFLNGQRLNAHRPYRMRDGDRLRLGQMIIRLIFQPPVEEDTPEEDTAEAPEAEAKPALVNPQTAELAEASPAPAEDKPETDDPSSDGEQEKPAQDVKSE